MGEVGRGRRRRTRQRRWRRRPSLPNRHIRTGLAQSVEAEVPRETWNSCQRCFFSPCAYLAMNLPFKFQVKIGTIADQSLRGTHKSTNEPDISFRGHNPRFLGPPASLAHSRSHREKQREAGHETQCSKNPGVKGYRHSPREGDTPPNGLATPPP